MITDPGTAARISWRRILLVGSLGGAAAGMMLAMVEMLYGWASSTHTFWDAPMAIWAWAGGSQHFGEPGNHVGPVLLGLAGHMANSMMLGVGFVALATIALTGLRRRRTVVPRTFGALAVLAGLAYGLGAWAVMRYGILPLRGSSEARLFTGSVVSPQWVWWLGHAALGMTAGAAFSVAEVSRRPRRQTQVTQSRRTTLGAA